MKPMTLQINNKKESETLQAAVFKASGSWEDDVKKIRNTNIKYLFISEDLKISGSNDIIIFNQKSDNLLSLSEAMIILDSLVEKLPFLNRSGVKAGLPYKIDSFIKDQYINCCNHNGIDVTRRIENLIAADIKARIYGMDLIEEIKKIFNETDI